MPDVMAVIEIEQETFLVVLPRHRWWNLANDTTI